MTRTTDPRDAAVHDGAGDDVTAAAPPRHRWAALGVLAAALAMIILDGTIVDVPCRRSSTTSTCT